MAVDVIIATDSDSNNKYLIDFENDDTSKCYEHLPMVYYTNKQF